MQTSAAGGVHFVPPSAGADAGVGTLLTFGYAGGSSGDILEYLHNNPTNKYYVSVWGQITRADSSGQDMPLSSAFTNSANQANNRLYRINIKSDDAAADVVANEPETLNQAGPFFRSLSVNGWAGTPPPTSGTSDVLAQILRWGNYAPYGGSNDSTDFAWIAYRFYLEDLTVSGRTHAEVAEIDNALLRAAAYESGGRFNGDTWTALVVRHRNLQ